MWNLFRSRAWHWRLARVAFLALGGWWLVSATGIHLQAADWLRSV